MICKGRRKVGKWEGGRVGTRTFKPTNFPTLQLLHHHNSIILHPTLGHDIYYFKPSSQSKNDHVGKAVSGFEKDLGKTYLPCPVFLKVCQSFRSSMLSKLRPHSSHPRIESIRKITLVANFESGKLSLDFCDQGKMESMPEPAILKLKRILSGKLRDSFMNPQDFFQRGFSDIELDLIFQGLS